MFIGRPTVLAIDPWTVPDVGFSRMRVTSPFGWRPDPLDTTYKAEGRAQRQVFHGGLDIGNARLGDDLIAVAAGTVVAVGYLKRPWSDPTTRWPSGNYGGWMLVLQIAPTAFALYAHMIPGSTGTLRAGSAMTRGQRVGDVGESGAATGAGHLHFGIVVGLTLSQLVNLGYVPNSATRDPWPLINGVELRLGGEEEEVNLDGYQIAGNEARTLNPGARFRAGPSTSDEILHEFSGGQRMVPFFTVQPDGETIPWLATVLYLPEDSTSGKRGWHFGYLRRDTTAAAGERFASGDCSTEIARAVAPYTTQLSEADEVLTTIATAATAAAKKIGGS